MTVKASTKALCLLGHPVAHSFSPFIHNAISKSLSLDYVYLAHDIKPDDLGEAVAGLKALGYFGTNVTVPHKTKIIPFLDEIRKEAKIIGAVNTISFDNNRLIGYNTDCYGFQKMLEDENVSLADKSVLILGAGGAARAVVAACIINNTRGIHICSRSIDKSKAYIKEFEQNASENVKWNALTYADISGDAKIYDIVVNCTPLGMHPNEDVMPVDPAQFEDSAVLVDLIYNPHRTKFLEVGEERGMQVVNGLGMLIHQALEAYRIWTGQSETAEFVKKTLAEQGIK